jgi:hypothetical protein
MGLFLPIGPPLFPSLFGTIIMGSVDTVGRETCQGEKQDPARCGVI